MCYIALEHLGSFRQRFPLLLKDAASPANRLNNAVLLVVLAVAASIIVPLYSTRMLPNEDGKIFSGGSCWADLPLHMHVAESFLHGRNQDVSWGQLMSPIFAGEGRDWGV